MRALLLAMAAGVALSGCQSDQISKTNTAIQSRLADACPKLAAAHAAFVISEIFVSYPSSVIANEKAIYAGVNSICADPSTVTVQSSVDKVLDAVDAINDAKANQ